MMTPVLPMNLHPWGWSWRQIWGTRDLPQILEVACRVPEGFKNHRGHSNSQVVRAQVQVGQPVVTIKDHNKFLQDPDRGY